MALAIGTIMDSIGSRSVHLGHYGQVESAALEWARIRPQLEIMRADDLIESTASWLGDVEHAYDEVPLGQLTEDQLLRLKRLVNFGKGLQNRFTRQTRPRP